MPRPSRPAIPVAVKLAVIIMQRYRCAETGEPFTVEDALASQIEFDHRPPLSERELTRGPYPDFELIYDPPANDLYYIQAVLKKPHDKRSHGPGGEKRITTAGSDSGNRRHYKDLRDDHNAHLDRMNAKARGEKPERTGSIQSRGFDKTRRRKIDGTVEKRE